MRSKVTCLEVDLDPLVSPRVTLALGIHYESILCLRNEPLVCLQAQDKPYPPREAVIRQRRAISRDSQVPDVIPSSLSSASSQKDSSQFVQF